MTTKFVYRFKLEPTPEQEHGLRRLAGGRRFWNWGLARRRAHYAEHGKLLRYPALNLELTTLKRGEATKWLGEMDSQALQESLRDLDRSFVNFFEKRARFPKFKKKHKQRDAFRIPQRVKIVGKRVSCPKVGWIRLRLSQPVTVPTKSATFKRDACGDWFVTLIAEREVDAQIALPINPVGIDLGLKTFATFSGDAPDITIPKFFRKAERVLRRVQRVFCRRKPGSTRRAKAKLCVSRVHRKTARQRSDFLHKTTTALVAQHDLICIEDLGVKGLAKTKLAKSILDAAFGEFRRQVEYKSAWSGKLVSVIGRFYPSSKLHRICATIKADLTLADREWTCQGCAASVDRDKNAAENILAEGLNLVAAGQADTRNAHGANGRLAKEQAVGVEVRIPRIYPWGVSMSENAGAAMNTLLERRRVPGTLDSALTPARHANGKLIKAQPERSGLSELHRITVDPQQSGGRPCLRNLRVRVKDVLDLLAAGASREEILEDYPLLEPGDITAALEYAARQSDHPVLRSA